ncbi:MAG: tRNA (adenosine(37)-N6)-threonylcarbamoyltransferase complex dimerization subunit type 1 TsaB [Nitrospirota bacterium]|jgi:tRNA threonylcarbamoyladenosine biosynthesis protein TsaB|nr:tRNA (adenosine(37)-N6)-threonylcarbamoyltransferase complex dimerization subunit type 1 TsaB [Nitrospirota bacterium]
MIFLAVETATSRQSVAIFNDQKLLGYTECESNRSLTTQIIPTIQQLLRVVSRDVADLEGLAVSIGPGTFTGLRVGLATMTAFRLALGIPLVGVPTLEGLAWNLPNSDLPIVSMVSIRADMVYWGLFQWEHQKLVSKQTDQMGKFSDVCAGLTEPTIGLGDGVARNRESLETQNCLIIEGPSDALWPSAKGVGRAGQELLEMGKFLPEGCTPRYIQPSYAETSKALTPSRDFSEKNLILNNGD